jgi:hypothetical protein
MPRSTELQKIKNGHGMDHGENAVVQEESTDYWM